MARNREIKAQISSIEALIPIVAALAQTPPEHVAQDDTFFLCPNGRLHKKPLIAYKDAHAHSC
ncbi:hypothetical protein VN23_06575 [Janthinobacterium sp. B9-8]|nr:hypothetical protein VN23_06575 [Janthinobacterium sp. B9-8]